MQRVLHLFCLALLVLCSAATARAGIEYTVELLDPGTETHCAMAINASGTVAIRSSYYFNLGRGYIWQPPGSMMEMGFAPEWTVMPMDINDIGWIVGGKNQTPANGVRPILYRDGLVIDLPGFVSGGVGKAHGINNSGVICGMGADLFPSGVRACVWENNVIRSIDADNPNIDFSIAQDINDSGTIAGEVRDEGTYLTQPFMYKDGFVTRLPTLPTSDHGEAWRINVHGDIIGISRTPYARATLWPHNAPMQPIDLGTIRTESYPRGINRHRVIVGETAEPLDDGIAFRWQNGQIQDLNTLISPFAGWVLSEAWGINDSGQIVGMGFYQGRPQAYLLTPIPLPPPAPIVNAIAVKPNKVRGLTPVLCSITLDRPVTTAPVTVELKSAPVGHVVLPATIVISSGDKIAFTILTKRVSQIQNVTLSARVKDSQDPWRTATLIITR